VSPIPKNTRLLIRISNFIMPTVPADLAGQIILKNSKTVCTDTPSACTLESALTIDGPEIQVGSMPISPTNSKVSARVTPRNPSVRMRTEYNILAYTNVGMSTSDVLEVELPPGVTVDPDHTLVKLNGAAIFGVTRARPSTVTRIFPPAEAVPSKYDGQLIYYHKAIECRIKVQYALQNSIGGDCSSGTTKECFSTETQSYIQFPEDNSPPGKIWDCNTKGNGYTIKDYRAAMPTFMQEVQIDNEPAMMSGSSFMYSIEIGKHGTSLGVVGCDDPNGPCKIRIANALKHGFPPASIINITVDGIINGDTVATSDEYKINVLKVGVGGLVVAEVGTGIPGSSFVERHIDAQMVLDTSMAHAKTGCLLVLKLPASVGAGSKLVVTFPDRTKSYASSDSTFGDADTLTVVELAGADDNSAASLLPADEDNTDVQISIVPASVDSEVRVEMVFGTAINILPGQQKILALRLKGSLLNPRRPGSSGNFKAEIFTANNLRQLYNAAIPAIQITAGSLDDPSIQAQSNVVGERTWLILLPLNWWRDEEHLGSLKLSSPIHTLL